MFSFFYYNLFSNKVASLDKEKVNVIKDNIISNHIIDLQNEKYRKIIDKIKADSNRVNLNISHNEVIIFKSNMLQNDKSEVICSTSNYTFNLNTQNTLKICLKKSSSPKIFLLLGVSICLLIFISLYLLKKTYTKTTQSILALFSSLDFNLKEYNIENIFNKSQFLIDEKKKKDTLLINNAILEEKKIISDQVAHDLKSPLLTLKTIIKTSDSPNPLLNKLYDRITDIIKNLNKKQVPENQTINSLINLLNDIQHEKLIEHPKVDITFNNLTLTSSQQSNKIHFNPSILSRIVSNLINNAVEANAKQISMTLSTDAKYLKYTIKDNGHGILHPEKVFSKGFSTKSSLGLGLWHAQEEIISWYASIKLNSKSNEETKFIITFPLTNS